MDAVCLEFKDITNLQCFRHQHQNIENRLRKWKGADRESAMTDIFGILDNNNKVKLGLSDSISVTEYRETEIFT